MSEAERGCKLETARATQAVTRDLLATSTFKPVEIDMKFNISHSLIAASLAFAMTSLAVTPVQVHAASTREQVKMDRDTFLATMRWDDSMSAWVLKDGMAMPQGVASRAEILAMRDKFLSMNTWDESSSQWVPVKGVPRDMSKLTREQVRMETEVFLKMYRYDESSSSWVSRNR